LTLYLNSEGLQLDPDKAGSSSRDDEEIVLRLLVPTLACRMQYFRLVGILVVAAPQADFSNGCSTPLS
jgi:hypothetical protein